jgi:hypothetical protein
LTIRDTYPCQLRTTISKAPRREGVDARRRAVEPERTIGNRDGLSPVPAVAPRDVHGRIGEGAAVGAHAGGERVELHDPADDRA